MFSVNFLELRCDRRVPMCKIRTYARFSENRPGRGRRRGRVRGNPPGRMVTLTTNAATTK